MAKHTEDKSEKKRRIDWRLSLRTKWTLIVAGTMVIFFGIFTGVLYHSVSQILLAREQGSVQNTLTAVSQRLSPFKKDLTINDVNPVLNPNFVVSNDDQRGRPDQGSFSQDSLVAMMMQEQVTVTVFNRQHQVVFNSRNPAIDYRNMTNGVHVIKQDGANRMFGVLQIQSAMTGQNIGSVIVKNSLTGYNASMYRLLMQIISIGSLVFVLILAVSVYLMTKLLRPVKEMTETMAVVHDDPNTDIRLRPLRGHDELSQLVDEFNGMLDRLQRYIQQQQQFVQDVSHELRTPVAVLEGHLQLLNRWGKDDPQVLDESLDASLQELGRMKHLIQEMLDLTRADSAATTHPTAVTVITPLLQEVYNNSKMLHPDFQIESDFDLPQSAAVQIYRNHLEQVLIILIDNAVKYSRQRKEIHLSAATDERNVSIIVQDFGRGIAAKDVSQIFNRFYRADEARSDEDVSGNGLGLSIAHRLITEYGGQISVESAEGHGSVFRIDLPLFKGPLPPDEAAEATDHHHDDDQGLPPGIIKMS
ncbi:HAMP domain-containing sensor histidine kinase [Schleiferilactobacillus perolens]|jgi:signal transduction histidine kinase|uniref:HAMP domain-containing sensor histidine kinase n=1 Tax=Schleiferilactobacillus perolens TaxID=100468 RepID=UPI0023560003|nr:HAMP domain-containing histidine kinase [Schleiferilactobacillus perolens]MCI2171854.1 HAMP domain-containing histidine kinase [Schleiferilactobacillus perolens]